MKNTKVKVLERPERRLIVKWSKSAGNYFEYVDEIGCGESNNSTAWDELLKIEGALAEPVGVWVPEHLRPEGTGEYAHGIEVPVDYTGVIPEGFDVIDLEPTTYLQFQGAPYPEEDIQAAISACVKEIAAFDPEEMGYRYTSFNAPRMQLAPEGQRGYVELLLVEKID